VFPIQQKPEARQQGIKLYSAEVVRVKLRKRDISTDIYRAGRMMRHIRDGYVEELDNNQEILNEITGQNLELAKMHRDLAAIDKIRDGLDAIFESLNRIQAPIKQYAREKLEDAVCRLYEVDPTLTGFERETHVGAACAELVAFRSRYETWRPEEIKNIDKKIAEKEKVLIPIRNEALYLAITAWLEKFSTVNCYALIKNWENDMAYQKQLLEILDKAHVDMVDEIIAVKDGMGRKNYAITDLERACILFNNGNEQWAKRMMREFALALGTRNALIVLDAVKEEFDSKRLNALFDYVVRTLKSKPPKRVINYALNALKEAKEEMEKQGLVQIVQAV
jgi:tetratricopeptide (TPR) repeat protein